MMARCPSLGAVIEAGFRSTIETVCSGRMLFDMNRLTFKSSCLDQTIIIRKGKFHRSQIIDEQLDVCKFNRQFRSRLNLILKIYEEWGQTEIGLEIGLNTLPAPGTGKC